MDMFVVRGGRPLDGTVTVSGAKNAALPIMAATLAVDGPVRLHGVPALADVATLGQLLESLGVLCRRNDGALELEVVDGRPCVAEYDLVRRMRAGVCVLGPMLARRGRACVSLPGGCNIGDRPIDLHLKGLRALGADIRVERGYVMAGADRLRGADVFLGGPFGSTVTGTCNVMCAAALAEGVTTIESAACEPEVVDLGNFLNRCGARVSGLGTPFLRIEGVDRLHGADYRIIPDRIEAATLMMAAAVTGGRVTVRNARLDHLTAVVEKLSEIGVRFDGDGRGARTETAASKEEETERRRDRETARWEGLPASHVFSAARSLHSSFSPSRHDGDSALSPVPCAVPGSVTVSVPGELRPADVIALPYPGIPTDLQAQLMALLTRAAGISVVTDKVFPDRFMHAAELVRLGAVIRREGSTAIIGGVDHLSGAAVMASDLRASAALVLAALAAEDETVVRRIYHLDRGYDRLENKLTRLGAAICRLPDEPANMPPRLRPQAVGVGPRQRSRRVA